MKSCPAHFACDSGGRERTDAGKDNSSSEMLEYSLKLSEHADILEQLRELERWRDNLNGNN